MIMANENPGKATGNIRNAVNTGNASNPSPEDNSFTRPEEAQLLGKKAEKYLREVASIEDVPDAQDQEEMDGTIETEEK